jgi:hypothetical protein
MSLINNALKKAQRQRSEGSSSAPTPGGTSHRPSRRGKAIPAQNLLLIVTGACVVVALSVAVTIYLLRTPNPPDATTSLVANTPIEPVPNVTASQPIPAIETPTQAEPEPITAAQADVEPEPAAEVIVKQLPEPPPPLETVAQPNLKIYTFIDQLQIMGVRFSGTSSKVLMNDRVYRVNDIVDRTLGLRLTTVTKDSLIFVDANGASYTKNF